MAISQKISDSPKKGSRRSSLVELAQQAILGDQTICLVYPNGDVVVTNSPPLPSP